MDCVFATIHGSVVYCQLSTFTKMRLEHCKIIYTVKKFQVKNIAHLDIYHYTIVRVTSLNCPIYIGAQTWDMLVHDQVGVETESTFTPKLWVWCGILHTLLNHVYSALTKVLLCVHPWPSVFMQDTGEIIPHLNKYCIFLTVFSTYMGVTW